MLGRIMKILEERQMIELALSEYHRTRMWVDTLPSAAFVPEEWLTCWARSAAAERRAATVSVEVFRIHGPRASYALLAGTLESGSGDAFQFWVGRSSVDSQYPDSLAEGIDAARAGLPREYAGVVLEVLASSGLRAGSVSIGQAAHGMVGSIQNSFREASTLLARLLAVPNLAKSEGSLLELVKSFTR